MPEHKADIQIGNTIIEVKSDMREQLVANLRSRTRQSVAKRHERVNSRMNGELGYAHITIKGTIAEGEPQEVLIKNRSAHLAQDIHRLRSRYAKILSED